MSGNANRPRRSVSGGTSLALTAALAAAGTLIGAAAVDHVQAQQQNRPSAVQTLFRWFSEDVLGMDAGVGGAGPSRARRLSRTDIEALPTRAYGERLPSASTDNAADEKTFCAVCQESFSLRDQVMRLPCFHEYHTDCIREYLATEERPLCPICRHPVSVASTY